jgi:hypothetical protein
VLRINGRHTAGLRLPQRCANCEAEYELSRFLRFLHSLNENFDFKLLQARFREAIASTWEPGCELQSDMQFYDMILASEVPPTRLIFLDLEYSIHTGRIHEVGIWDANGDDIVDCATRLSEEELARTEPMTQIGKLEKVIEQWHVPAVQRHQHKHDSLDIDQLVEQIRQSGITTDTKVVVWACSTADLSLLRRWFEAEGHKNVLPLDSQCIRLLQSFRSNLPRFSPSIKTGFPLQLPILF